MKKIKAKPESDMRKFLSDLQDFLVKGILQDASDKADVDWNWRDRIILQINRLKAASCPKKK
jgi:hypothetical protein